MGRGPRGATVYGGSQGAGHLGDSHFHFQDPMVLVPSPPPEMFCACLLSVENFSQRISSTREQEMLKQKKNKVKRD